MVKCEVRMPTVAVTSESGLRNDFSLRGLGVIAPHS